MLKGKVASILGETHLVINLGAKHGVIPGMQFKVVNSTRPIVDPDDPSNTMDGLTFEIAKLEAVNVFEKFTYCKILDPYTYSTEYTPFSGFLRNVERVKEPKIDPDAIRTGDELAMKIKVGSEVIEIAAQAAPRKATESPS